MPNFGPAYSFVAGEDIRTARFVILDSTIGRVLEGDAGEFVIGVGQNYSYDAPTSTSDTDAARLGEIIGVYGVGQECYLTAGENNIAVGNILKSDNEGRGAAASAGDKYGALALEASTAVGQLIRVLVQPGELET